MHSQTDLNSMYYSGKAFSKFASILIAVNDIVQQPDLAQSGVKRLESALSKFITNTQTHPLAYDSVWKGVVSTASYNAEYCLIAESSRRVRVFPKEFVEMHVNMTAFNGWTRHSAFKVTTSPASLQTQSCHTRARCLCCNRPVVFGTALSDLPADHFYPKLGYPLQNNHQFLKAPAPPPPSH